MKCGGLDYDNRERAREIKDQIYKGINPIEERKKEKAKKFKSFSEIAYHYHKTKISPELKNDKGRKSWINSLENHAFKVIGDLNIEDIDTNHIRKILDPIWLTTADMGKKVQQRLKAIFDYAIASEILPSKFNPARWDGHLSTLMPNPDKNKTKSHYKALPPEEVSQFIKDLRDIKGIAPKALEFLILTAARPGMVRSLIWTEIDLSQKVWSIPNFKMKKNERGQRIPLSEQAVELLINLPKINEYIFPSPRGKALSDGAMNSIIKNLDKKGKKYIDPKLNDLINPHGFRSTFKDWARQPKKYNHPFYSDELSELALAHVNSDETSAAYARNELLEERRPMMEEWGKFCR
ncbi:MAG: site-specific integrase [Desulforegulaceae bacterium]|nr:site-specific integrase [Desulforegulaceae bacterium]